MNRLTDQELLREYAERRSEPAFAELVRRHLDVVYSAALRLVRDAHLAQDVSQGVFLALAQSAPQLTARPVLSGWLHLTTRNLAANAVRTDVRRRAREQEAVAMNEIVAPGNDPTWEHLAPHLDPALAELNEGDRDALLLRYFERKSAAEMGALLGITDVAAQKRVTRAVERLRDVLAKRGLAAGAGALSLLITANAVQAAPAGLALAISTAAASVGAAAGATLTTATFITTMSIKIKLAGVVALSALLAGTGTYLYQQRRAQAEQAENARLKSDLQRLSGERDQALATATGSALELQQLRKDQGDLLRLRNEVNALRRQTNELAKLAKAAPAPATASTPPAPPNEAAKGQFYPKDAWAFVGYAQPEATFQTVNWAALQGDLKALLAGMGPEIQTNMTAQWAALGKSEAEIAALLRSDNDIQKVTGYRIVHKEVISEDVVTLTVFQEGRDRNKKVTLKRINNEWKIAG